MQSKMAHWRSALWILGSRSPRRLELLRSIVPEATIRVRAPRSPDEAGFEGLSTFPQIHERLREVTRRKSEDVLEQARQAGEWPADGSVGLQALLVSADTTVIVGEAEHALTVLGQPPEDGEWTTVVRDWFRRHLLGRTHRVSTCVRLVTSQGGIGEEVVTSRVAFPAEGERWLEWYLGTGESRGKAGGYAIQGAGSVFVSELQGSLSNVIGLPLLELMTLAERLTGSSVPVQSPESP